MELDRDVKLGFCERESKHQKARNFTILLGTQMEENQNKQKPRKFMQQRLKISCKKQSLELRRDGNHVVMVEAWS